MSRRTIERRSRFRAPIPSGPRAWRASRHDPRSGLLPYGVFREAIPRGELRRSIDEARRDGTHADEIFLEIRATIDAIGEQSASILDADAVLLERVEAFRHARDWTAPPPDRPRTHRLIGAPRAPGAAARA